MENSQYSIEKKPEGFLIVGIGASAGGIQALKEFFQHVPADSGLAYVVILHLSPDHDSQLAQVLQTATAIPIEQVMAKVKIEPDHVYVVPPNQHLVIQDSFIMPVANLHIEDRRAPVDIFFRHLADTHGPRAVCVVLSGTGANGSMGLKRVKELGGVAFVQNPREAEFNEMPRNSIATELVDEVLPVAEIPAAIITYRNNIGSVQITEEAENRPEQQQQALREIFTQLRIRTGHDFSNYKRATLLRRIERRINIHNLPDLSAYASLIQESPDETTALLKDLLISVTNFFRDKKAFQSIEQDVIPALLHQNKSDDQIRVWVAGCATGEEAYSLAMLFAERTLGTADAPKLQIFATDIDETAIAVAREGFYTLNDAADVSTDKLRRFFNKEGDGYRVRREIRETILFANHNFLKDPPFSRLHLVTCRNVLIYLNHTAQERVMETFHFALKPRGFLFLGTSESVDGASDLYAVFNRENHIFQAREVTNKNYPAPESVPKFMFPANTQPQPNEKESRSAGRGSFGELHQKLLEEYAPPSVVVNEEYEIVHMSEKAGKYLEFSAGEPTQNLLKLVRPEIRLELRSALYQATQKQTAVEARNVKINIDNQVQFLNLQVRPALHNGSTAKGFILVIFEPNEEGQDAMPVMVSSDEPVAKQLEEELIRLKSQLLNSNEEHEFQAEELKAANEELQAMNEELRSAAEELETSKEELQSINEELRTVNQELKVKIEEMSLTSNNLQNLINSADVGTIFLDRSFRTRLFTPAVREIFNLIPSDYGRPISDITHKLDYPNLLRDAEAVLEKLTVVEREVKTTDNGYFMMRILPYRTSEDRINGIVITFFNITLRKQAELALHKSEEYLRLLIESANDYAILSLDTERKVTSWSNGAKEMIGYLEQEIIGQSGDIIFTPEDREKNAPEKEAKEAAKEGRAINERWHMRKDGSRFWGSGSSNSLRDSDGKIVGFVKIMRDLTERKQAQQRQAFLLDISDAMRAQSNEEAIGVLCTSRLAEFLQLERCYLAKLYSDEDKVYVGPEYHRFDLRPAGGEYRLSDFPEVVRKVQTETVVISDVARDPNLTEADKTALGAIDIGAFITAGVRKGNEKVLWAVVIVTIKPRVWTQGEVAFLEDVAERIWAAVDRAKAEEAVRKSEDYFRLIATAVSDSLYKMSADWKQMYNLEGKHFLADTRNPNTTWVQNYIPEHDRNRVTKAIEKATRNKSIFELEHQVYDLHGELAWTYSRAVPKLNEKGEIIEWIGCASNITQRKKAEEALRESEERLRTLIENLPGGAAFVVNTQLRYLFAGGEALNGTGMKPEDFIGKTVHEAMGAQLMEVPTSHFLEALHGQTFSVEHEVNSRSFLTRGVPLRNGNEEIYAALAVSYDITSRKLAEKALVVSENRFRTLTDAVPQVIWSNDAQGRADYFNQRWYDYSGLTYEESFGIGWEAIVHPDDAPASIEKWHKSLAKGEIFDAEYRLRSAAGKYCWFIGRNVPLKDDTGNVLGWFGSATDIETLKNAEEVVRTTADRLQLALEAGKLGTYEYDFETKSYVATAQHKANFGFTENDPVSQESLKERVVSEDKSYMDASFDKALNEKTVYSTEYRTIWPGGDVRWIRSVGRFVYNENGEPQKMVGITLDITEEKMFTEELSKQVKERTLELQQSNNDLQQFAHVASHDLKEPVRKIKTFNNRIMDDFNHLLPEKVSQYLNKINSATDRMYSMIDGILSYSKVANAKQSFEIVDLDEIVKAIESDLEVLMQEKQAVITTTCLPVIIADKTLIYQLFYNLILNSLKFSKKEEPCLLNIFSETVQQEQVSFIKIILSDNGIGFEPEFEQAIFETFTRLNPINHYEGTGLGLALCKKIVQRHNGFISAHGEPGKGATFIILLPL